ncbi:recombinase RecT, partial [Nocardiopsis composta]
YKYTIQAGIDGLRVIAERTGRYEGRTPIQWCGEDGVWRNVWLDRSRAPVAARCAVYKRGFREPLEGVAHWAEFVQTRKGGDPTPMWATKGAHMLGKVAEALALRAAFPQDLSGIYTPEETAAEDDAAAASGGPGQTIAEAVAEEYSRPSGEQMVTPEQLSEIAGRIRDLGMGKDAALEVYAEAAGRQVPTTRLLTAAEAEAVIEELARRAAPPEPEEAPEEPVDAEIVDDAPADDPWAERAEAAQ